MKQKLQFVSPRVTRAVPLFPETDLLFATSTDDLTQFTSVGQEEVVYDGEGEGYTIDLY